MKGKMGRLLQILLGKSIKSREDDLKGETVIGYKFVSEDLRSLLGDVSQWTPGVMLTYNGEVEPGSRGFHASSDLRSAFYNKLGDRLFEVEARGVVYGKGGLFAAKEMTLTREIDLKPLSVEYAIGCARHVLPNYENDYPDDARPREAIKAAENWLKEPTEENRISAEYAADFAWYAAVSAFSANYDSQSVEFATRSAESAAESASWYVDRSTAVSATRSAAWFAVWSAADSAGSASLAALSAAWSARSAAQFARSAAGSAAGSAANPTTEKNWQAKLLEELVKKYYL